MTRQEQIEEMAKTSCAACTPNACCPLPADTRPCDAALEYAEALYDAGYRKVFSGRDDFVSLLNEEIKELSIIEKTRKETAREILGMLYDLGIDKNTIEYCGIYDVNGVVLAKRISSQYGVEVEE